MPHTHYLKNKKNFFLILFLVFTFALVSHAQNSPPGPFTINSSCGNWPNSYIEINPNSSAEAASYNLEKRVGSSGSWSTILTGVSRSAIDSYADNNISAGNTYYYRVLARNSLGSTYSSNVASENVSASNCGNPPTPTPTPTPPSGTCFDYTSPVVINQTLPSVMSPGQVAPVSISIGNEGNTWWWHGSAYQFTQRSNLQVSPSYGALSISVLPANQQNIFPGWAYAQNWTFNVTAPTTPGNYTLQMQMVHKAGWIYRVPDPNNYPPPQTLYSCPAPGSDTYFGYQLNATFTVSSPTPTPTPTPPPPTLTPTPTPTPPPPTPTPTPTIPLPPIGPTGSGGTDQPVIWKIINPLRGLNNSAPPTDIFGVLLLITDWILNIAGSLIIILIIYAGVQFVISRGNPGQIQKAKNILWWALIGYAVILVGKGFIFIVDSVLRGEIPTFL